MNKISKITNCLWFDNNASEAVTFYTCVFKNAHIGRINHYTDEGKEIHGMPEGTVMTIEFVLEDQAFLALNGGPHFKFNEAISFIVYCDTQEEIDYYWNNLKTGGDEKAQQCGWLKDKFGVSWQITPTILDDMMMDNDKEKVRRVTRAMLQMKKLDIAELQKAFEES